MNDISLKIITAILFLPVTTLRKYIVVFLLTVSRSLLRIPVALQKRCQNFTVNIKTPINYSKISTVVCTFYGKRLGTVLQSYGNFYHNLILRRIFHRFPHCINH